MFKCLHDDDDKQTTKIPVDTKCGFWDMPKIERPEIVRPRIFPIV